MAAGPWLCHVGRQFSEGRGPLIATELARKAHDECVSMAGHVALSSKGTRGLI